MYAIAWSVGVGCGVLRRIIWRTQMSAKELSDNA